LRIIKTDNYTLIKISSSYCLISYTNSHSDCCLTERRHLP